MSGDASPGAARARPVAGAVEWPTLALILAVHLAWLAALFVLPALTLWLAVPAATVAAALHSSLTHEVIHGHPTRDARLNALMVALPLTLFIPFARFRDQHLAHHRDEVLTDPYDDPESNYLDPAVWNRLPRAVRAVLAANNTLAGRILIGPLLGLVVFLGAEAKAALRGDRAVRRAWALHLPAAAAVVAIAALSPMPLWAWLLSLHLAFGLLKVRTFLEHRAHERASGRTVVIEDRGPFAFLFLNNNLHVVHHMHPSVPWYDLPALYRARREHFLRRNGGYRYRSYGEVFRRHFLRAKDPVPHPLWPQDR